MSDLNEKYIGQKVYQKNKSWESIWLTKPYKPCQEVSLVNYHIFSKSDIGLEVMNLNHKWYKMKQNKTIIIILEL